MLAVGFTAYGLSIFFYVYAQRSLGAARTSAYYAVAPFIGTFLSLLLFREMPHYTFFIALALMAAGAWLCAEDKPLFRKKTPAAAPSAQPPADFREAIPPTATENQYFATPEAEGEMHARTAEEIVEKTDPAQGTDDALNT